MNYLNSLFFSLIHPFNYANFVIFKFIIQYHLNFIMRVVINSLLRISFLTHLRITSNWNSFDVIQIMKNLILICFMESFLFFISIIKLNICLTSLMDLIYFLHQSFFLLFRTLSQVKLLTRYFSLLISILIKIIKK